MVKLEKSHYWKAKIELEVQNLAFSSVINKTRKGMRIDSLELSPHQSWIKNDDIIFDIGKRVKGWIKEQIKTIKPSLAEKLKYSFTGNSILNNNVVFGHIPIAKINQLSGLEVPEDDILFKLPATFKLYPFRNVFVGENKNYVNQYYYLLETPIKLSTEVFCWTKDFTPDDFKNMLAVFGAGMGIGDLHSQGYGKFKLISFEKTEEKDFL